jgi:hypothetical protein
VTAVLHPRAAGRGDDTAVLAGGAAAAVVAGAVAAGAGVLGVAALGGVALVLAVAARPQLGAYALLAGTPLVVGMNRDAVIPLLRPNEALLLLVAGGLALRWGLRWLEGERPRVQVTRVHVVLLALAVTSSVTPLLWMYSQGRAVEMDDLLYAATLWKYLLVFVVVRASIRHVAEVSRALWLTLAAGAIVAVLAVLQSLQFGPVTEFLGALFAPDDDPEMVSIGRGSSTIGSAIAVGDVMTFNLAIALAWLHRGNPHRMLLGGASVLFVLGALGSGQFSGAIALAVGALTVAAVDGRVTRLLKVGLPVMVVAGLLLQPVLATRLEGFDSREGVPQSWTARLDNLEEYFWPELGTDFNWALGVRTSSRVPAPEVWREFVFIESGHTWLLWNGGVPLLAAFVAFVWIGLRTVIPIARARRDAVGVAAAASTAAFGVLVVLMLLDPHLTMRGTADLSFALLALALTCWCRQRTPEEVSP